MDESFILSFNKTSECLLHDCHCTGFRGHMRVKCGSYLHEFTDEGWNTHTGKFIHGPMDIAIYTHSS
jgi:hypothetical protein